jgi:hypothetical protein
VGRFTVASPLLPEPTTNPTPTDLAQDVEQDVILSWDAADQGGDFLGTLSFDVYFGDDFFAVSNADHTSELFLGNQLETEARPAEVLGFDKSYFWRVDAVNEAGASAGLVWTFTTDPATAAPTFQGVSSLGLLGTDALGVTWKSASDDRDDAASLSYDVFVATTRGGHDFETPTATVTGDKTSVVLTGDAVAGLLDGESVHVVVRSRDTDGTSNNNTVEISLPVPSGLDTIFVDASAPTGGDGSFAAPLTSLSEGFAQVESGGVLLVAGGTYDGADLGIAAGAENIHILGGFPPFADLSDDEATLLNARDIQAHITTIRGALEDPVINDEKRTATDITIDGEGRWIVIDGLQFIDVSTRTMDIDADRVTLTGNHFKGGLFREFRINHGYATADLERGGAVSLFNAQDAAPTRAVVVGNHFDGGVGGVLLSGAAALIHLGGNRANDVEYSVLRCVSRFDTERLEEVFDPLSVTQEGLEITVEENEVRRGSWGLVALSFDAIENGGDLSVRGHRNRARGVRSAVLGDNEFGGSAMYFNDVSNVGDGAEVTMSFTHNKMLGISRSAIDVSIAKEVSSTFIDPNNNQQIELLTFEARAQSVQIEFFDNDFLHTNDSGARIRRLLPANGGNVSIDFVGNQVGNTEGEAIDIASVNNFSGTSPVNCPQDDACVGVGGTVRVNISENISESTDAFVSLRLKHLPQGNIDIDITDNISLRDNGDCIDVDIVGWVIPTFQGAPAGDRDVLIARNRCETEDDIIDMNLTSVAGNSSIIIRDNTGVSEQGGIELDQIFPELFPVDNDIVLV